MATNEYLPFCGTDTGTNLPSQAAYSADPNRPIGNQPGIASSKFNNKALRQANAIASQLAQYIANKTGLNMLDDGNFTTILNNMVTAFTPAGSSTGLSNAGVSASVALGALTLALKQQDGATDATAFNPVSIDFRSSTLTSGLFNLRQVTAALSIVIPSGATLGQGSGNSSEFFLYALDNAGTVELAVSSKLFDQSSIVSTTAITSGATSETMMYSTSARTNVPFRLVARLVSNQVTAGTWALVPTQISLGPSITNAPYSPWVAFTPTSSWVANITWTGLWRRVGQMMQVQAKFVLSGNPTNAEITVNMPTGFQIDPAWVLYSGTPNIQQIGTAMLNDNSTGNYNAVVQYSTTTAVLVRAQLASGTYVVPNGFISTTVPFNWGAGDSGIITWEVPILGWA